MRDSVGSRARGRRRQEFHSLPGPSGTSELAAPVRRAQTCYRVTPTTSVAGARALPFQDTVLNIINQIMDVCIPQDRAPRDFCVKFPEEIRHDSLAGQLWFGAEVAAAARLQGHGVGVVQPFLCQPGSALEHGPDRGVWGAPVGWAGRGQEAHDPGPVGPPLLPAPGA